MNMVKRMAVMTVVNTHSSESCHYCTVGVFRVTQRQQPLCLTQAASAIH